MVLCMTNVLLSTLLLNPQNVTPLLTKLKQITNFACSIKRLVESSKAGVQRTRHNLSRGTSAISQRRMDILTLAYLGALASIFVPHSYSYFRWFTHSYHPRSVSSHREVSVVFVHVLALLVQDTFPCVSASVKINWTPL